MKIEKLALAICKTCGAFDPQTDAFRLNNPGLLKAFSPKHDAEVNDRGSVRKFLSWQAGFKALCFDLMLKCQGESRAKLQTTDPLTSLLNLWEIKDARKTVLFLRRAIGDESITELTELRYFV